MGGLVPLLIVKSLYTNLFINNTEFVVKTKRAQEFWYQPLFSPQGVYVVLLVSFLVGAAAAFFAFQAEHPQVLQIKQRSSLKARLLFRGVVYSLIALVGGVWLGIKVPTLWIIYGFAIIAFLTDFVAVYLSTPFVGQPMAIGIIRYGVYSC